MHNSSICPLFTSLLDYRVHVLVQISMLLQNINLAALEINYSDTCIPQPLFFVTNKQNSRIQTLRAQTTSKQLKEQVLIVPASLWARGDETRFFQRAHKLVFCITSVDEGRNF